MKILGHGIDLILISRFQKLLQLSEEDFLARTFSNSEIAVFPVGSKRFETIAGRFATKEAVLKALGTGFGNGVSFIDIEVFRDINGPPNVKLSGCARTAALSLGISSWLASISHSEESVIASVIAIGE